MEQNLTWISGTYIWVLYPQCLGYRHKIHFLQAKYIDFYFRSRLRSNPGNKQIFISI